MKPRLRPSALASLATALVAALLAISSEAHDVRVRRPLRVPDVPGFVTLRCDLHTHTVFSDGSVWPDIRAEEAWREGYDAIAITDHVEYQPHRADLPTNHDRPWEIAAPPGEGLGVIVIHGSEVTRKMPPGHVNAVFLKSSTPLETPDWRDALRAARAQGAFLFWNHPGWKGQQKDGVARWYPEHTEMLAADLMHGIEVVNDRTYYPEAHRWALEKDLAILANSDVHDPANLAWHVNEGDHRPGTLVFAKERTEEAIREALFARRTAAFSGTMLAGREAQLRPLVATALRVENPVVSVRAGGDVLLRVRNDSDLRFEMEGDGTAGGLSVPRSFVAVQDATSLLEIHAPKGARAGCTKVEIPFVISNVKPAPDSGLPFSFAVEVEVLPPAPK